MILFLAILTSLGIGGFAGALFATTKFVQHMWFEAEGGTSRLLQEVRELVERLRNEEQDS